MPAEFLLRNDPSPPYDYEPNLNLPLAQSLNEDLKPECSLKCPENELCMWKDKQLICHCPESINFFRINKQCREMWDGFPRCDERNPCDSKFNEECVEGTCQCLMGYRRDLRTYKCENRSGDDVVSASFL